MCVLDEELQKCVLTPSTHLTQSECASHSYDYKSFHIDGSYKDICVDPSISANCTRAPSEIHRCDSDCHGRFVCPSAFCDTAPAGDPGRNGVITYGCKDSACYTSKNQEDCAALGEKCVFDVCRNDDYSGDIFTDANGKCCFPKILDTCESITDPFLCNTAEHCAYIFGYCQVDPCEVLTPSACITYQLWGSPCTLDSMNTTCSLHTCASSLDSVSCAANHPSSGGTCTWVDGCTYKDCGEICVLSDNRDVYIHEECEDVANLADCIANPFCAVVPNNVGCIHDECGEYFDEFNCWSDSWCAYDASIQRCILNPCYALDATDPSVCTSGARGTPCQYGVCNIKPANSSSVMCCNTLPIGFLCASCGLPGCVPVEAVEGEKYFGKCFREGCPRAFSLVEAEGVQTCVRSYLTAYTPDTSSCTNREYTAPPKNDATALPCGVGCVAQDHVCTGTCKFGFAVQAARPGYCLPVNVEVISDDTSCVGKPSCLQAVFDTMSTNSNGDFNILITSDILDLVFSPLINFNGFSLVGGGTEKTTIELGGNQLSFVARDASQFALESVTLSRTDTNTPTPSAMLSASGASTGKLTLFEVTVEYSYTLSEDATATAPLRVTGLLFLFDTVIIRRGGGVVAHTLSHTFSNAGTDGTDGTDDCAHTTTHPAVLLDGASGTFCRVVFEGIDSGALSAQNGGLIFEAVRFTGNKIGSFGSGYVDLRHNAFFKNISLIFHDTVQSDVSSSNMYNLFFTTTDGDNTTFSLPAELVSDMSLLFSPIASSIQITEDSGSRLGTFTGAFVGCTYAVKVSRDGVLVGGMGLNLPLTVVSPTKATITLPADALLDNGTYEFEFVYTVGSFTGNPFPKATLLVSNPLPFPPEDPNNNNNNIIIIIAVVVSVVVVLLVVVGIVVLLVLYKKGLGPFKKTQVSVDEEEEVGEVYPL